MHRIQQVKEIMIGKQAISVEGDHRTNAYREIKDIHTALTTMYSGSPNTSKRLLNFLHGWESSIFSVIEPSK